VSGPDELARWIGRREVRTDALRARDQSELGRDGHPRRGGFLPPVNLPRRMWAGSGIRFGAPLRVGQRVEQSSVVERIEEKSGRAGALLLDLLRRHLPAAAPERFSFKALRPTFDVSPFSVEGEPDADGRRVRLWSTDNRGAVSVEAEAFLR
jgi:hydroxyacyl-ACP dehydratase HTD2-like protein with hotdog domain